jgi:hypothetical protein
MVTTPFVFGSFATVFPFESTKTFDLFESKLINSVFLCLAQFKLTLLMSSRDKNPKALNKENQIRKNK